MVGRFPTRDKNEVAEAEGFRLYGNSVPAPASGHTGTIKTKCGDVDFSGAIF